MIEKTLGAEDNCPFCKCKVKCGVTTYQGESKLQWQNPDGKAHYKPNKGGCNVYGVTEIAPVSPTTEFASAVNVESVIPKPPMNQQVSDAMNIVLTTLGVVENHMSSLYPKLDKNSSVYGQIRSKLVEDTLRVYCAIILKPKE